jgi:hypothetical protein
MFIEYTRVVYITALSVSLVILYTFTFPLHLLITRFVSRVSSQRQSKRNMQPVCIQKQFLSIQEQVVLRKNCIEEYVHFLTLKILLHI